MRRRVQMLMKLGVEHSLGSYPGSLLTPFGCVLGGPPGGYML